MYTRTTSVFMPRVSRPSSATPGPREDSCRRHARSVALFVCSGGATGYIGNACDICPSGDDSQDMDGNTVPDTCEQNCEDGLDNDGNGLVDCADLD